jgi:hypothetical protein
VSQNIEVRSSVELPSRRENITLHTSDGLALIGELATPLDREPVATLVMLHPLRQQWRALLRGQEEM